MPLTPQHTTTMTLESEYRLVHERCLDTNGLVVTTSCEDVLSFIELQLSTTPLPASNATGGQSPSPLSRTQLAAVAWEPHYEFHSRFVGFFRAEMA